jgi:hypothetical protein
MTATPQLIISARVPPGLPHGEIVDMPSACCGLRRTVPGIEAALLRPGGKQVTESDPDVRMSDMRRWI